MLISELLSARRLFIRRQFDLYSCREQPLTKSRALHNRGSPLRLPHWRQGFCPPPPTLVSSRLCSSSLWCSLWEKFSVLSSSLIFALGLEKGRTGDVFWGCNMKWMGLEEQPSDVTTQTALQRKQQWRPTSEITFPNAGKKTETSRVIFFISRSCSWYRCWSSKTCTSGLFLKVRRTSALNFFALSLMFNSLPVVRLDTANLAVFVQPVWASAEMTLLALKIALYHESHSPGARTHVSWK